MSKSDKDNKGDLQDVDLNSSDSDWVEVKDPDSEEWVNVDNPKDEESKKDTHKPESSITLSYAQAVVKGERSQGK